MINTLLEHVPIKMEANEVEVLNNNGGNNNEEEQVKDDDDINSEDGDDDDAEEDDLDEEDDDDEEEEEDLESDALEVEQEVTLLMSSDEEAELEAQRIRFPEKRNARKKSQDSKSSRSTSRNSNTSSYSDSVNKLSNCATVEDSNATKTSKTMPTDNLTMKQTSNDGVVLVYTPATELRTSPTTTNDSTTTTAQRTSPRNRKETLNSEDKAVDLRQATRRQSNNSTCSVASSIGSTESSETESCGNIYVYQQEQKLIFNCEFCDLKYGDLENLSRHLFEAHHLFHNNNNTNDEDQEKENSPRNLRNHRRNQLPPGKASRLQQQQQQHKLQQSLNVKKEPTESTTTPPVAICLDAKSEQSLQSCGNVFILNHRKLFLVCGHCESKYANVELFEKHLRQQHNVFELHKSCNEVNVIPKTEIKQEVFIITEVVEKAPRAAGSDAAAMVIIPAEIPLDIRSTEDDMETMAVVPDADNSNQENRQELEVASEIPMETTEVISSIQIHDSGVTVAEIPVIISTEETTVQEMVESSEVSVVSSSPTEEDMAEVVERRSLTPPKKTRKRRSSPEKPEAPKSPYKRPRRNARKTIESLHVNADKNNDEKSSKLTNRRKSVVPKKDEVKQKESETPPPGKETPMEAYTESTPIQETTAQSNIEDSQIGKLSQSKAQTSAPKRKRKSTTKTKVVKEEPISVPRPTPTTAEHEVAPEGISDRDEEFLEDPVAEIIEQIQNEINNSNSCGGLRLGKACTLAPTSIAVSPFTSTSHPSTVLALPSMLQTNSNPNNNILNDPQSPEDIKPIIIINHLGERRFVCDQCPRSFRKNVRLVEHKRLHTGEKPFGCDECGKRFRIRMQLNEHKLRHSKEKKFICEICQLGCCTKQDLNLHMRHHTNDRRFHCSMCPKAFVRNSDLKIHIRVHTGEKPYVCDICHKCFRANQNLSVHKKSHMGEASKTYQCEHCDKKFLRNIDRTVHMRTHTGEKPFKCQICDRGYSSKFNVRAHIERDHIAESGKKKPGPKPRALREELEKQKKLIEQLQQQLLQQIKTDEKIIPADSNNEESDVEDEHHSIISAVPTNNEQGESFIISEISSPTSSGVPLTAIPSPPILDNPFTKAARQKSPSSVVPLTITQKIPSNSPPKLTMTATGTPKSTTTKVVQQKTSLGIQQVSVTVSMQVENVSTAATTTPEKENAGISNLQLTTTSTAAPSSNSVKKERKITSYFTVVGQKAEV